MDNSKSKALEKAKGEKKLSVSGDSHRHEIPMRRFKGVIGDKSSALGALQRSSVSKTHVGGHKHTEDTRARGYAHDKSKGYYN